MLTSAFHFLLLLFTLNVTLSVCLLCEDCPLPCEVPGVCTTKAKCFVRRDVNGLIYRGCADKERWKDLDISDNSCSLQHYLGWNRTKALWCFCDTTLCNRRNIKSFSNGQQILFDIARNESGILNSLMSKNKTQLLSSKTAKQSISSGKAAAIDAKQGKDAANFRQHQLSLIFGIKLKERNKSKNEKFDTTGSRSQGSSVHASSNNRRPSVFHPLLPYNNGVKDSRFQVSGTRSIHKKPNRRKTKQNKPLLDRYSTESKQKHHLQRNDKYSGISEIKEETFINQNQSPQIYPVDTNKNSVFGNRDSNKKPLLTKNRNTMPEIYPLETSQLTSQNSDESEHYPGEIMLEGSQPPPQENRFDINLATPTPESILPANRTVIDILTPFITKHVFHNNNYMRTNFSHPSNDYQIESNAKYFNDTFVVIDGIFERRLPQIWPTGFKKPLDAKESKQEIDKTLIRDKYVKDANLFSKDKVGPNEGLIVQQNYVTTSASNLDLEKTTVAATTVNDNDVNEYKTEILAASDNKIRAMKTSYLPSATTGTYTKTSVKENNQPTALTNTTFKYQLFLKQTTPVYPNFTQMLPLDNQLISNLTDNKKYSKSTTDTSVKKHNSKTDLKGYSVGTLGLTDKHRRLKTNYNDYSNGGIDRTDKIQFSKTDNKRYSNGETGNTDKQRSSKIDFSNGDIGSTDKHQSSKTDNNDYSNGAIDNKDKQQSSKTVYNDYFNGNVQSVGKKSTDSRAQERKPSWKYNFSDRVTLPVSSLRNAQVTLQANHSANTVLTKIDEKLNEIRSNTSKGFISQKSAVQKLSIKITPLKHGTVKQNQKLKHNSTSCGQVFEQDSDTCPDNFIYVPRFKSCYMFSKRNYHNYTTSREVCQKGSDIGDLITIETHQEYKCISEWLQSLPELMDGWQGWWTGGMFKQDVNDFIWSHDDHVINKTNQEWQPSLVVHPYDNTCIWFVPLSDFSLGNYWCDEIGGFICETKAKY